MNDTCAGSSSGALSLSLAGLGSELDMIASKEVDDVKADKIHKTATSLQIAAWALTQLQSSVKGFYGAVSRNKSFKTTLTFILKAFCPIESPIEE